MTLDQKRAIINQSRLQAYGRPANAGDYEYWLSKYDELDARGAEIGIHDYAWRRLIGWQATGADAPLHGPYADPPSALLPYVEDTPVPTPTPGPSPVPVPSPVSTQVDLEPVLAVLAMINAKIDAYQNENRAAVAAAVTVIKKALPWVR